jgi:hypothetical protein
VRVSAILDLTAPHCEENRMPARVIQGYFVGGQMRALSDLVRPALIQRKTAPGAPAPAFAGLRHGIPGAPARAGTVQRHGGNGNFEIDPVKLGLARVGGLPLAPAVLAKMEAAFGADFSAVRVHVGPQASRIGAIAFTTGNDLYFAPGQYQPDSIRGQQLIGHELTHVIQQRSGRVRMPVSGIAVVQDQALEAEADRLGRKAASMLIEMPRPKAGGCATPGTGARSKTGCGCGCGPALGAPMSATSPIQRATLNRRGATSIYVHGKGRRNAPRSNSNSRKDMTKRQIKLAFAIEHDDSRKKPRNCQGGRPSKALWGVWNGDTRPAWSVAAAALLPAACVVCGAAATDRDHIVPYRIYISDNAAQSTICDGTCHFLGVSSAEAALWSSHLPNVRPLCAACNGLKAATDRANPQNVSAPPTPAGVCPNAPLGCQGGACNADICL